MTEMLTIPLHINGKDVTTTKIIEVTAPTTGKVIHHASSASVEDAVAAADAAAAAFESWAALPANQKRDIFLKAADALEKRLEEAASWEMEEAAANPFYAGGFDAPNSLSQLRDVAGKISGIVGTVPQLSDPTRSAMVLKEPFGVVLAIAPWNATFTLGFRSVTYAIAAGNTAVLKAPEFAPKSFSVIGAVFKEAGLPDGVLNIIQSSPEDASAVTTALIKHPAVKKINFTGSTHVGRIIAKMAGENLKPVLLELGGKAPAIILADADLKLAAAGCAMGAFLHSGQICMSTERVIVEKGVVDEFAKELKDATEMFFPSSGDALVLVTPVGVKKNKALLKDATSKGAEVVFGDINAEEPQAGRMRPVVVKGVTKDMDLFYTESFGPTLALYEVENEEEAVKLANDTEYGLAASVFTKDLAKGLRVAKKIQSGAVHINAMSVHDEAALPHGGWKSSGWGRFGAPGLEEWLQTKTITYQNGS